MTPEIKDWIDIATASSTTLAAIFTAISAWASKKSAQAAKAAVDEAQITRRAELSPRLVLEKDFLDFQFQWPHNDSLNGEAIFLSRKHWKDKEPTPPLLTLQNFGQSPAIELTIIWEVEDPNGDYIIPKRFLDAGISIQPSPGFPENSTPAQSVFYTTSDGRGAGFPLYRKVTTDIPSCSPGQLKVIEFPQHILNIFFVRGLQLGHSSPTKNIVLSARIIYYSIDNERHERIFKWTVIPFSYGEVSPVLVYGHFFELSIHPKPTDARFE